ARARPRQREEAWNPACPSSLALLDHTPHERRDVQTPLIGLDPRREALLGRGRDAMPALVGRVEVTSITSITSTYRWPCGPSGRAHLNLGTVKAGGNHGD